MKAKLIIILIVIPSMLFAGYVQELEKRDKHLISIKNLIKDEVRAIKDIKDEKTKTAREYQRTNLQLAYQKRIVRKMEKRLASYGRKISRIESEIIIQNKQKRQIEANIKSGNFYLAGSGESELLEELFFSEDIRELTAAMQIISEVNATLFNSIEELAQVNKSLKRNADKLRREQQDYENLLSEKKAATREMKAQKQLAQQLYKTALEDEKIRSEYVALLKKREKSIERNIKQIEQLIIQQNKNRRFDGLNKSFSKMKKRLSPPVKGVLKEKFGRKKVEGFRGTVDKKGIKITPKVRTVSAVYDGIVIHTDSSWGLGQFVIIEHFGGYYTLYANLSDVSVEKEQKVKTGEPLGIIDIDRQANTSYLYFEIRKNDKAIDPMLWISSL